VDLGSAYAPLFDSETDNYVLYGDRGNSELRFKVSTSGGAERPGIPSADIPVNEWIHVAGVYDGTQAMIYLNGELKDSHALTGTVKPGQRATMGKTGSVYLEGIIDQVEVYSRALTPAEIGAITDYYLVNNGLVCPEVTASVENDTLIAGTSGEAYQWLDCDLDFAPVQGETGSFFLPGSNGNYAVAVSNGTCVDTSECILYQATGMKDNPAPVPAIYPNPSDGAVTLDLTDTPDEDLEVCVIDASGRVLMKKDIRGGRVHRVDLSGQSPGIYQFRVESRRNSIRETILIF
jgi:hypothetical protein